MKYNKSSCIKCSKCNTSTPIEDIHTWLVKDTTDYLCIDCNKLAWLEEEVA